MRKKILYLVMIIVIALVATSLASGMVDLFESRLELVKSIIEGTY